ncbi:hypothetical protein KW798_03670 [Candidatus Parcubacteria bacterium]|nr:hypothetical protein [Candidatus Parcubacteria bacterium]
MLRLALTYQPYMARAMALCAAVIVISVFLYGFLLLEAVGHTASRSQAESKIRQITSELGTLEANYLHSTKEVTPELAASLGFVKPIETSVLFVGDTALSLNAGH